jgi:hypothetical protein
MCWDLNGNGIGDIPAEDIDGDNDVDVYDCKGPQGDPGVNGIDGLHCWDLNGNGVGDIPAEDIDGDNDVDVYDCKGPQGDPGVAGAPGADGTNGTHCWDLNGNGVGDVATEDLNGDGVVDVGDCAGLHCWDLNGNGVGDIATEDLDGDGDVDVDDCTGPAGPGTLMVFDSRNIPVTIGTGPQCTWYTGLNVTITPPSDGFVVVSASVWLSLSHANGVEDMVMVMIGNTQTDCGLGEYRWQEEIPSDLASHTPHYRTASPQRVFAVTGGMTYNYYVTGIMYSGGDANDQFYRGNMFAVFYPS